MPVLKGNLPTEGNEEGNLRCIGGTTVEAIRLITCVLERYVVTVVAAELQLCVPVELDAEHQRYCRARAESRVGGGRGLFCNAAISQIQHLSHMPAGRCGSARERSERNVKREFKHVSWECKETTK